MFIISLTYKTEIANVEPHMAGHMAFLETCYQQGVFLASGRKVPRTGGVILANADSREALESILQQDPFCVEDLVDMDITEIQVSKTAPGLEGLLDLA